MTRYNLVVHGGSLSTRAIDTERANVSHAGAILVGMLALGLGIYAWGFFWPLSLGLISGGVALLGLTVQDWYDSWRLHSYHARYVDALKGGDASALDGTIQHERALAGAASVQTRTIDLIQGGRTSKLVIDPLAEAAQKRLLVVLDAAIKLAGTDATVFPSVIAMESAGVRYRPYALALTQLGSLVEKDAAKRTVVAGGQTLGWLRGQVGSDADNIP